MERFSFTTTAAVLVALTGAATAAPVHWGEVSGGNGHYYDYIGDESGETLLNFDDARAAAATSTYLGSSGYLVTITSSAEQAFLDSQFGLQPEYYIAASDSDTEGAWYWVAGPEDGTLIGTGAWPGFTSSSYENWSDFEPNDFNGNEDFAVNNFSQASGDGSWNDVPSFENYYVVEYSSPTPVPLPASGWMLLASVAGIGFFRKRLRDKS